MARADEINRAYYEATPAGKDDYWRKMAAPRHRMDVLLGELERQTELRVVDLGCGNGTVLAEIARRMPRAALTGIDLSEAQIALNRAAHPDWRWESRNLDGSTSWGPGLSRAFDAIVATEVVEHVDDPLGFLRSAQALGASGAYLYLSTQSGPIRETERRVGHRRHFSAREMQDLLRDAGFAVERVWNTGFPFHDLSKWAANLNPDAAMRSFGEQAYGVRQDAVCWALRAAFRLNSGSRGAQLFAVARVA